MELEEGCNMIDLSDLTFTIPVRYDTDDRIMNLLATMSYLTTNFKTNIIIAECDSKPIMQQYANRFPCHYVFMPTTDDMFHRTKILNDMAKMATTPYIVNYDVDCVLPKQQYIDAITHLRMNNIDVCTGFNSFTYNVPKALHPKIVETKSIDWLTIQQCVCANSKDYAMGGVVFWNKEKFMEAGMENENFVSWGPEDQERVHRAIKLGYRYGKIQGTLYHLEHRRLQNSWMTHRYIAHNDAEFAKIQAMDAVQLRLYVNSWPWVPRK